MHELDKLIQESGIDETLLHYGVKGMKWDNVKDTAEDIAAQAEGFESAEDKAKFEALVKKEGMSKADAEATKQMLFGLRKSAKKRKAQNAKKLKAPLYPKDQILVKDQKKAKRDLAVIKTKQKINKGLDKALTKAFGKNEKKLTKITVEPAVKIRPTVSNKERKKIIDKAVESYNNKTLSGRIKNKLNKTFKKKK